MERRGRRNRARSRAAGWADARQALLTNVTMITTTRMVVVMMMMGNDDDDEYMMMMSSDDDDDDDNGGDRVGAFVGPHAK